MKIFDKFLTILRPAAEIARPFGKQEPSPKMDGVSKTGATPAPEISKPVMDSLRCPYCSSKKFVRRGWRQKKLERVQLYLCPACHKTFTLQITKGKHYPLNIMLDAISIYNLGYSLEQTCRIINSRLQEEAQQKTRLLADSLTSKHTDVVVPALSEHTLSNNPQLVKTLLPALTEQIPHRRGPTPNSFYTIQPSTLSTWLKETEELCRFSRMREFALKKYSPKEMVIFATLAHQQLYRYRFHRAKCELMIQEQFQHRRFEPLKEFLEMVPVECPHQYFQEGLRASETPLTFSKTQMIVRAKQNYATRLCEFVLQSVKDRKLRHEALQKFMLANDSVTVATEVPVYITRDDLEHLKSQLGFEIYEKQNTSDGVRKHSSEVEETMTVANSSTVRGVHSDTSEVSLGDLPKLITGHIDILQIRNGQIHILDYKPRAEKEQPIEQLTLYAMALSRLTGLRLFEFKCAWFDEKDYFEFYPLHVLHKPRKTQRRRKVYTMEGLYQINKNPNKIESVRPNISI